MKIYHVEPNCYGSSGTIVLADREERALELYIEKNNGMVQYELRTTELSKTSDKEFCCPDFEW